ncbi:UDP-N-acetyl-D-mannosamine dehydrogenase [Microbulbifer sp. 2205BS26-8]|uniref:UDP-N-acetyl-D-mannosamine dehydrogenase n=1 Tax=Microbulbifer sp. 2205BS26-8 TaxID=3064386 RepID=UPI00273D0E01|nr:UDP-N-acetyl-D-mannosamine dehydrogenase [Microbulbifer sp. 2205BS26-8]MDP5210501.1 UDP-N-acetyl-D-mannosamine dehydrogenase [Microbulbifer sp. 2205BS26-8]
MISKNKFQSLNVIGLGYIGLPTAAVFASRKIRVCGVDINKETVNTINRGEIHIVEPDLDIAVHSTVKEGFLKASLTPESSDAFIIAVPTPFKDKKQPDLSCVEAAVSNIAPVLKKGDLIILESTSPVGTTEHMAKGLAEFRSDLRIPTLNRSEGDFDVFIAHCPERVLPGRVMRELVENARIIGGMTKKCAEMARELYKIFVNGDCLLTDVRTAEMAKLTENAFRDVNIAFSNELSLISDKIGINVWELINLANRHPRVNILQPGCGVGGHCIAVDPWFLVSASPELARITRVAREVNDSKPEWVVAKISKEVSKMLEGGALCSAEEITIACFGLTFKPDIDDLRESPALEITKRVAAEHAGKVLAVEPHIGEDCFLGSDDLNFFLSNITEALEQADILVMLVDHKEFKSIDKYLLSGKKIIDTKGIWK